MDDFLDILRNDHHQFDAGKLEDHIGKNPMELLASWLREATEKGVSEPNAISISTIGLDRFPDARIVYVRELVEEGIIFYTNYLSAKGKEINSDPKIHGLIFWPGLERQIRITGLAEKIPEELSDSYFAARPRGSKLGAWASHQSDELESREELEKRIEELSKKYPNDVPRPPHWGGYLVKTNRFEFWQGRPSRLHDRIVFEKEGIEWKIKRLNP